MKIKAILFDLDGTLIDSEPWQYESYRDALNDFGFVLSRSMFIEDMVLDGLSAQQFLKKYNLEINRDDLVKRKQEYFRKLVLKEVNLRLGIAELLDFVRKNKLKRALVTSSRYDTVEPILEKFDLKNFFDCIVTRDDVILAKPDKEPYQKAMQKLNLKVKDCIVLEDNPCGIRSAKANKLFCIAIPHDFVVGSNFSEADLVLEDFFQVNEFVAKNLT